MEVRLRVEVGQPIPRQKGDTLDLFPQLGLELFTDDLSTPQSRSEFVAVKKALFVDERSNPSRRETGPSDHGVQVHSYADFRESLGELANALHLGEIGVDAHARYETARQSVEHPLGRSCPESESIRVHEKPLTLPIQRGRRARSLDGIRDPSGLAETDSSRLIRAACSLRE